MFLESTALEGRQLRCRWVTPTGYGKKNLLSPGEPMVVSGSTKKKLFETVYASKKPVMSRTVSSVSVSRACNSLRLFSRASLSVKKSHGLSLIAFAWNRLRISWLRVAFQALCLRLELNRDDHLLRLRPLSRLRQPIDRL